MTTADNVNILVVDDLPEKLLVYRSILEEPGQSVITAYSGAEALKQVLLHDFAVILLDVNMPDMDGFETAGLIRNRKKSAHTPIIFVTALLDEVRLVQGYAHGAVDYILSPVAPEILRAKVKVFVDLYHMHQQVKRQAEESVALAEERAKRAAAEEANRASQFLARASTVLARSVSMDLAATLRGLAHVAVPFLADLSVACLAAPAVSGGCGHPSQIEWAWTDKDGQTTQPHENLRLAGWMVRAIEQVIANGKYQLLTRADIVEAPDDAPGLNGAKQSRSNPIPRFEVEAALVLPLNARGKTLGALALVMGPNGRQFTPDKLGLAEDLASRAGIAVDNALLVRNIQEDDRRKDEFLAMLAHELRNPLAPICNAVQLLRLMVPPQPEIQSLQDVIDRQLGNLTRLVDDLLDVSRITSGKVRLKLESLDVAAAVSIAVETSRPLIEARRQNLSITLPAKPARVKADQTRLAQILANLLNNAAKYTHEGGQIWLSVTCENNPEEVVFRVRDNGVGIPPEILPCVFDLFTQADQSLDRAQGGLGIGLTLVRRLVQMHHGTVQAFSKGPNLDGKGGSEFVVRLPALPVERAAPETPLNGTQAANQTPAIPKRRVLIVDDNMDTAESLAMLMRIDGHEVQTAHDGPAALKTCQSFLPEVVLLDIGLPNLDGYEVARMLRKQPQGHGVILAALTGYGNEEDRCRSQQAGFDHHLVKPVRLEALRRLMA
jgi:signal transduction histidine kinase/DNA-binding response OmpR family regulator